MSVTSESPALEWKDVYAAEKTALGSAGVATRTGTVGLALSGGGIRSATFNLGVLQALASQGLLRKFDYLSTVSGGGYIGCWLTALIKRVGGGTVSEDFEKALAATADGGEQQRVTARPDLAKTVREAVEHLRTYSNYLTPRPGMMGLDTLTGIAIYCRNLGLNFALILCVAIGLFLVPHLVIEILVLWPWSPNTAAVVGLGLMFITAIAIGRLLAPVPVPAQDPDARHATAADDGQTFLVACLALVATVAIGLWLFAMRDQPRPHYVDGAWIGAVINLSGSNSPRLAANVRQKF